MVAVALAPGPPISQRLYSDFTATLQGISSLMLAVLSPFSEHLKSAALLPGKRINRIWHQVLHLITSCPVVGYSVLGEIAIAG